MKAFDTELPVQDIDVVFWRADLFNGFFSYYYVIPKPHDLEA